MIMVVGKMNCGCIRLVISASVAVTSVMCLMIVVSMPTLSKGEFRMMKRQHAEKITVCLSAIFLTYKSLKLLTSIYELN